MDITIWKAVPFCCYCFCKVWQIGNFIEIYKIVMSKFLPLNCLLWLWQSRDWKKCTNNKIQIHNFFTRQYIFCNNFCRMDNTDPVNITFICNKIEFIICYKCHEFITILITIDTTVFVCLFVCDRNTDLLEMYKLL